MTDLTHFIRTYERALEPAVCDRMVDAFESMQAQQVRSGRNFREALSESSWTELDLTHRTEQAFKQQIAEVVFHFKAQYEDDCGIRPRLPDPASLGKLMMKRYDANGEDNFQPHYDSVGPHANRYLVFLWYLNDVAEGGETDFVDLERKIAPVKGRLLMFPPYWMWRHTGRTPVSNAKYILSTYLLL